MIYFLTEQKYKEYNHAGFKAKLDATRVFEKNNFIPLYFKKDYVDGFLNKCIKRFSNIKELKLKINELKSDDYLFIQFPIFGKSDELLTTTFCKLKKRGVKIIFLIHDLDFLRNSKSNKEKTISILRTGNKLIVHNNSMKDVLLNEGFDGSALINLEIFDYLISDEYFAPDECNDFFSVIIAGNLDYKKSSYIYKLPTNVHFNIYGINFDETKCNNKNVIYKGSFKPDLLHRNISGSFGLVWDGDSISECSGECGRYLVYNNPHKMSFYLAAGIPIIIWNKAAQSEFVRKYNCGIVVDSLCDLNSILRDLPDDQYKKIKLNAINLGKQIREGKMLEKAIQKCFL